MAKKKKNHAHKFLEKYLDMPIPKEFYKEVLDAMDAFRNCDRSTLERVYANVCVYKSIGSIY